MPVIIDVRGSAQSCNPAEAIQGRPKLKARRWSQAAVVKLMMPEAYKLVRYLSHNNLANNKISKVDYYMYAYRLEIIRNLMKWFSFFFIVLTKVPTTRSSEPPRSCLLETFALPQGLNGKCPCLSLLSLICRTCTFSL